MFFHNTNRTCLIFHNTNRTCLVFHNINRTCLIFHNTNRTCLIFHNTNRTCLIFHNTNRTCLIFHNTNRTCLIFHNTNRTCLIFHNTNIYYKAPQSLTSQLRMLLPFLNIVKSLSTRSHQSETILHTPLTMYYVINQTLKINMQRKEICVQLLTRYDKE